MFGVLGALLVLAGSAVMSAEIVERGALLPWAGDDVKRVEVWGGVDFYLSSETEAPERDLLTAALLLIVATVCAFGGLLLLAVFRSRTRADWFFIVAAAGAAYLAVDEYFAVHESVGHNLAFLRDLPVIDRPDDALFLLYIVPATAFLWFYRRIILGSRAALACFAAGIAITGLAAVIDITEVVHSLEDPLELLAAMALAAGFAALAVERVRQVAQPSSAVAPEARVATQRRPAPAR